MARRFSGKADLNNATPVTLESVEETTSTIFVTKITLSITTHATGKFVAVQDTAGSPYVIAKHIDATAAAGVPSVVHWDFGAGGVPITAGKNLQCVSEAAGVAGIVYVEGYQMG
jgi:hypothetical protein